MKTRNMILGFLVSLSAISAKAEISSVKQQRVQLVASFLQEKDIEFCNKLSHTRGVSYLAADKCVEYVKAEQRTIKQLSANGPGYDILRSILLDRGLEACKAQYATDCWELIQSRVAAFDAIAAANYQVIDILAENFAYKADVYRYGSDFTPSKKAFVQLLTEMSK
ncbi:hypothetical protein [Bdellovibrio sp. KM01]|uniref:hypothetical protein n=1 Tax=Bdellovibrio sp. KM01 TaxID=2748865 RepID=UPI0015EA8C8F|nr:hypothetical protein [Bdellovibrio sp. KM01]QLY24629.1 hypothetical protein HW988_14385 [Bdellovibrio sp. KM01]